MKKIITLTALIFASSSAFAAFNGPEVASINSVSEAMKANDDSFVILTGNISKSLGNELYLFNDKTGEIEIEIDDDNWMGVDVTPNDTVVIRGEVDTEWSSVKIDVDTVQLK
ncbi:YgiW/YdeI family stress tolerance OB fold protein [Vibrio renipiscarius]|uniref:Protein YgiW n=1 Tax=Vibrio renipiscarius TaxID=1461322 RepID=A0A0C2JL37_9VIBR|nr:NirD/YgiW/YdeI family stress tolerance protein [Vibrio renipiscarius]KII75287.1 protein YgiW precursor [Vibrio renipiscarius]KII78739.1 protein YgiW precursor [Vibrio renipiscarius]